jgi:hypothetical protein
MVLSTNKKLKNAMENLPPPCNRGGTKSLNHTQNETLLDSPIVISIETKPEQGDLIGAHVQLAVWAAAHLNRLEELIRLSKTDAKLPWLPLLLVHGPKWFLLFARRNTDDKTVSKSSLYPSTVQLLTALGCGCKNRVWRRKLAIRRLCHHLCPSIVDGLG